ncbi:MAG: hypothetical protein ABIK28_25185 [Planctomycetota bacterium]
MPTASVEQVKKCPYHIDHASRIRTLEDATMTQWEKIGSRVTQKNFMWIVGGISTVLMVFGAKFMSDMSDVKQDVAVIKALTKQYMEAEKTPGKKL